MWIAKIKEGGGREERIRAKCRSNNRCLVACAYYADSTRAHSFSSNLRPRRRNAHQPSNHNQDHNIIPMTSRCTWLKLAYSMVLEWVIGFDGVSSDAGDMKMCSCAFPAYVSSDSTWAFLHLASQLWGRNEVSTRMPSFHYWGLWLCCIFFVISSDFVGHCAEHIELLSCHLSSVKQREKFSWTVSVETLASFVSLAQLSIKRWLIWNGNRVRRIVTRYNDRKNAEILRQSIYSTIGIESRTINSSPWRGFSRNEIQSNSVVQLLAFIRFICCKMRRE